MFGKTGSMLLSIGNLPPQVSRRDLKSHVRSVIDTLGESSFRFPPTIRSCSILRLTNTVTGVVAHRGLVSVQPPRLALALVEALEQKPLRGLNLQVSRYRHGSFPVRSSMRLVSMTDLFGPGAQRNEDDGGTWKLDIVADTGLQKPTGRREPQRDADGAFAI